VAVFRRPPVPANGDFLVLRHTASEIVLRAEIELRVREFLLGRLSPPFGGFEIVLLDAVPVFVGVAEIELRRCVALIGGKLEPLDGLRVILLDAFTLEVKTAETELGELVAGIAEGLPDSQGLGVITGQIGTLARLVILRGRRQRCYRHERGQQQHPATPSLPPGLPMGGSWSGDTTHRGLSQIRLLPSAGPTVTKPKTSVGGRQAHRQSRAPKQRPRLV